MYGFVDVADYQKVVVTESSEGIIKAAQNYLGGNHSFIDEDKLIEKEIVVQSVKDVVINGITYYYIIDTNNNKYRVSINIDELTLPFVGNKDKLVVYYTMKEEVTEIVKIGD